MRTRRDFTSRSLSRRFALPPRDGELAELLKREAREIEIRLARRMPQPVLEEDKR